MEQSREVGEVEVKAQTEVLPRCAASPELWIGIKGPQNVSSGFFLETGRILHVTPLTAVCRTYRSVPRGGAGDVNPKGRVQ